MGFPLDDWQFWSVTACAAGAAWVLIRQVAGGGAGRGAAGACASCPKAALVAEGDDRGRERLVSIGERR